MHPICTLSPLDKHIPNSSSIPVVQDSPFIGMGLYGKGVGLRHTSGLGDRDDGEAKSVDEEPVPMFHELVGIEGEDESEEESGDGERRGVVVAKARVRVVLPLSDGLVLALLDREPLFRGFRRQLIAERDEETTKARKAAGSGLGLGIEPSDPVPWMEVPSGTGGLHWPASGSAAGHSGAVVVAATSVFPTCETTLLATGGADRRCMVFDMTRSTRVLSSTSWPAPLSAVHLHSGLRLLAAGDSAGTIRVFRAPSPTSPSFVFVAALTGHSSTITSFDVRADGATLASGGSDAVFCVWPLDKLPAAGTESAAEPGTVVKGKKKGKKKARVVVAAGAEVAEGATVLRPSVTVAVHDPVSAVLAEDDGSVLVAGESGLIRRLTVGGKEVEPRVKFPRVHSAVVSVCRAPHIAADALVVVYADASVALYSAVSGACMYSTVGDIDGAREMAALSDEVVAFVPGDDAARLLSLTTQHSVRLQGHKGEVLSLAAEPTTGVVVTGGTDTGICLYRASRYLSPDTGSLTPGGRLVVAPTARAAGHTDPVDTLAIRQASVLSGDKGGILKAWRIRGLGETKEGEETKVSLRPTASLVAHEGGVTATAVAVDTSGSDGTVGASGGSDHLVCLWSLPKLTQRATLRGHRRPVWALAFNEDATLLASGSGDRTIRTWAVVGNQRHGCLHVFEGFGGSVLRIGWLWNAKQLAAVGTDGTLRLYPTTETVLHTGDAGDDDGSGRLSVVAHHGRASSLVITTGSKQLLTAGDDGVIRLWRDETLARAEEAAAAVDNKTLALDEFARLQRGGQLGAALYAGVELKLTRSLLALCTEHVQTLAPILDDAVTEGVRRRTDAMDVTEGEGEGEEEAATRAAVELEVCTTLLEYAAGWNTKAPSAPTAQQVVQLILQRLPARAVAAMPPTTLDALEAYTVRHRARVLRLARKAKVVGFVAAQRDALA